MDAKSRNTSGLKSCEEMQLIKIMNEAQQGSSDNIIEKNVREIKGKTGEKLKEEMLYPGKFTEL